KTLPALTKVFSSQTRSKELSAAPAIDQYHERMKPLKARIEADLLLLDKAVSRWHHSRKIYMFITRIGVGGLIGATLPPTSYLAAFYAFLPLSLVMILVGIFVPTARLNKIRMLKRRLQQDIAEMQRFNTVLSQKFLDHLTQAVNIGQETE